MKPTRATQPYRRGARAPGAALTAMLRGRTTGGFNPADIERSVSKLTGKPALGRPARPPRPKRPARPPR